MPFCNNRFECVVNAIVKFFWRSCASLHPSAVDGKLVCGVCVVYGCCARFVVVVFECGELCFERFVVSFVGVVY